METARLLVERGDALLIFPEGTRIRRGSLGDPKRGVGRLALETGAPVVPVAVMGTERARRGFIIRPCKVRVRCGRPLTFPRVESPSAHLASEVTARIWPCVELQYEWLGGMPALRTAAVVGAGPMGTALASLLARAGLEVELGCRTREQAERIAGAGVNHDRLPGVELPDAVSAEAGVEDRVPGRRPRRLRRAEPRPPGRRRRGRREHRPPHRRRRLLEGPRPPVRHAPVRVRRRARPRPRRGRAGRPGSRRRGRDRETLRSWSPRTTPTCGASSFACSRRPARASRRPTTSWAPSSPRAARTSLRWPRAPPPSIASTTQARPRAGSSPRCTRSRGTRALAPRPSPAPPASATSSRP